MTCTLDMQRAEINRRMVGGYITMIQASREVGRLYSLSSSSLVDDFLGLDLLDKRDQWAESPTTYTLRGAPSLRRTVPSQLKLEIREKYYAGGTSLRALGRAYGYSPETIRRAVNGTERRVCKA